MASRNSSIQTSHRSVTHLSQTHTSQRSTQLANNAQFPSQPETRTVADYIDDQGIRVRYVEVPQITYKEVFVDKPQIIEIERKVPEVQIVEVEKIVELSELHEVTREVEVIQEEEVIREVPRKEIIEVPVEKIREVPILQRVLTERVVEKPGDIVYVDKHFTVENRVVKPRYTDKKVNTVVSQVFQPRIRQTQEDVQIHAYDYDPVLCKVLIHVPKPVPMPVFFGEKIADSHKYVEFSQAEYNGLVRGVNRPLSLEFLRDIMFTDVQTGNPIEPVNENSFMSIVSPKTTNIKGVPLKLPINTTTIRTERSVTRTADYRTRQTSPNTWRTPRSRKFDTDAERYYREHHSYFKSSGGGAVMETAR